MEYALGVPAVLILAATVVGAVTGKLRLSSCCSVADPANDLRMRDAFASDPGPTPDR